LTACTRKCNTIFSAQGVTERRIFTLSSHLAHAWKVWEFGLYSGHCKSKVNNV